MTSVFRRRLEKLGKSQARSWAEGGIEAGAAESPGPEKTTTSSGRVRMSLSVSTKTSQVFDPGELGAYKIPNISTARRGMAGYRFPDDVFIQMGTDYSAYIKRWGYRVMEAAHNGGRNRIQHDQRGTIESLSRVL